MYVPLFNKYDAICLALILRNALEGKRMSETLQGFLSEGGVSEVSQKIRAYAQSKLEHPVIKLALREMNEVIQTLEERENLPWF